MVARRGVAVQTGQAFREPTRETWAVCQGGRVVAGTNRIVNLTASLAQTSIVGNILDRGGSLRHPRVDDLLGLEVVLPGGDLIHVGWWPSPNRLAPSTHPDWARACSTRLSSRVLTS